MAQSLALIAIVLCAISPLTKAAGTTPPSEINNLRSSEATPGDIANSIVAITGDSEANTAEASDGSSTRRSAGDAGLSAKDGATLAGGFVFLLCFGLLVAGAVCMMMVPRTRASPLLPIAMAVTALAVVGLTAHTVHEYGIKPHEAPLPPACLLSSCAPTCGDGTKLASEACDNGGGSFDGCSDKCKVECGYTCTGGSPTAPDFCESTCGDGIMAFGAEACDDGNTADGDGCSATCTVEPTHVCKNKNCTKSSCKPKCGDGTKFASEACDNGGGYGCSDKCKVECGYTCTGGSPTAPDVCESTCGDGILAFGTEACDDGNTADGDGCSATCTVESSYFCTSKNCTKSSCKPKCGWTCAGGDCTSTCGDGYMVGDEACDDGNTVDGDGCSATCTLESTHTCEVYTPGFEWRYWMTVLVVGLVVLVVWGAALVHIIMSGKQDKTTPLPSTDVKMTPVEPMADTA